MIRNNSVRRWLSIGVLLSASVLAGCASVPMASQQEDAAAKTFSTPAEAKAAIYVYRDSNFGASLKKLVTLDGKPLFQSAPHTYYYEQISPGKHTLATESEFGDNSLEFTADAGKMYFFRNYIKMGVFVGGANLEEVSDADGKTGVQECSLAAPLVR